MASERPLEKWEKRTAVVFILLCFGLFSAELLADYSPVKLGGFFIVLFWIPLLALHEAGHALAALALGWRIRRVVIGFGVSVASFNIGDTAVEIRAVPLEGFVLTVPGGMAGARFKNALIFIAGPCAEVALLAVLIAAVGPSILTSPSADAGVIAGQSCAISVSMGLVFNLIPHTVETRHGPAPNDGLGVLRSFFLTGGHSRRSMEDDR